MKTKTTQSNLKRTLYRTILLPAAMIISVAAYSQSMLDKGNDAKQSDPAAISINGAEQTNPLHVYPNPLRNTTQISYYVSTADHIKLSVRDNTGKTIRVLVDEYKLPGLYTVDFDAEFIRAGGYYCIMESVTFRASERMIIVK